MDVMVQATGPGSIAAIAAATPTVDEARLDALKSAATALYLGLGFSADENVEVHLAMGDDAKWAVVRVAKVVIP